MGTKYLPSTRHFFRYLTQFSFEYHRVSGNLKYQVLPDISGKSEYLVYPKYPEITSYPRVNMAPGTTPKSARYPIFFSIPNPNPPNIGIAVGP